MTDHKACLTRRAALLGAATAGVALHTARAELADVKARGTLIVGTSAAFPPFTGTTVDGTNVGFDVAFLTAVAGRMGVKAQFVTLDSSGVFPGLLAKKFDTACAAYVMTEERVKAVNFTVPYAIGSTVMVVRKSDTAFNSYYDLKGRRVGVILGSVDERRLRSSIGGWGELKTYPGWTEEWIDLMAGRVDGLSTQYAVAAASLAHERDANKARIAGEPVLQSMLGYPTRKDDNALRVAMNAAIASLQADGTAEKLSKQYLGYSNTAAEIDKAWSAQNYIGRVQA
jgi:ABC-type amino acid transport substrate-binding protein